MNDLAEFLLARLADDEQTVRGYWRWHRKDVEDVMEGRVAVPDSMQAGAYFSFAGRFTGPRLLADIEAKRRIAELHSNWEPVSWDDPCCSSCGDVPQVPYPCETLRFLAAPYSDHPDFDPSWGTT